MKIKKYLYGITLGALSLTYASCYNADKEFPDYEGGTTAYFAYQFPVRTLVLGNDIYDNSLDNAHKCRIYATMGGAYYGRNANVDIVVDESLCDNLFFADEGGNPSYAVLPMPTAYYKLASNTIPYKSDSRGYVEVQFADEFFNDPKAIENTYVIPLRMTKASGIDDILTGQPLGGLTPSRTDVDNWKVRAKDYVLYCVQYINPWTAKYIRRGVDVLTENGKTSTFTRKDMSLINSDPGVYTENPVNANDEVVGITTKNMKQSVFAVTFGRGEGLPSVTCDLILTFDGNKCVISSEDPTVTASGSGEYIAKGTELKEYKDYQWGSLNGKPVQRDILRLSYDVNIQKGKIIGVDKYGKDIILTNDVQVSTTDTLVVQTRDVNKKVFFHNKYVKQ